MEGSWREKCVKGWEWMRGRRREEGGGWGLEGEVEEVGDVDVEWNEKERKEMEVD